MDLLQFKYFQTVARLEHMTRAAGELQVAQPALSATISKLEDDLGVELFNRTGRNIVLNEFGKVFLKRVDKILREVEEGRQEISDMSGSESGFVAFSSTSLNKEFGDFIFSFNKLYPKVNFHITQLGDDRTKIHLLETNEIDFAFINTVKEYPNISAVPLLVEDIFLAVSPEHYLASRGEVSLGELTNEPFINMTADHSLQEFCDYIYQKNGFTPKVICECSESSAIVNLVAAGIGISFYPCVEEKMKQQPIVLLKIKDLKYKNILQIAWKKKRYFSKAAINFRDYVINYFV
ncbi:LysR family transcriptional regulator [Anaerocolumna jejuensis]|uniref:LysR family transcriptional regulator n=1 Tax=Anaerocolumna jejuensis TaxID=259063 RepID=UPI003F7B9033